MNLREAIEKVLHDSGRPMSSREIADKINAGHLYTRGDGAPLPASQVSARINHHLDIFKKVDGKIALI